jgi:beta-lactam-binding protein with PASTA domain
MAEQRISIPNAALAKSNEVTFVDLSAKTAKAQVVREGYQVASPVFNTQKAQFFVDNLVVVNPKQTPRVISQSIAFGTKVARGTVVDLVLARPADIPFDIFDGVHKDLKNRPIAAITDTLLEDPKVRETVLKYEKVADIPAAEKEALRVEFGKAQINIDEAQADATFDSAFQAVRGASAFR